MLKALLAFLSAVPGSIKNVLSREEQLRVVLTAINGGSAVAIISALASLFGVPLPVGLIAVIAPSIVYVFDYVRRKYFHGTDPTDPPAVKPTAPDDGGGSFGYRDVMGMPRFERP